MILGVIILVIFGFTGMYNTIYDNNSVIDKISYIGIIVGIIVGISGALAPGKKTVDVVRSNKLLVGKVEFIANDTIEYTIKTTVYPKWTGIKEKRDTIRIKASN